MSVVVPVSGSHTNLAISGQQEFSRVYATLDEMDGVEDVFEGLRSKINGMNLQFPQHSLFNGVCEMMGTTVGPIINEEPDCKVQTEMKKEFAQTLRLSIENIMPWQQFLEYST